MLKFSDLDEEEKRFLSSEFMTRLDGNAGREDPYTIVFDVLSSFGIMCTHPRHMRKCRELGSFKFYECSCCGCNVIDQDDQLELSEMIVR